MSVEGKCRTLKLFCKKLSSTLSSLLPTLVTTTHPPPSLLSKLQLTLSVPVKDNLQSYSEIAHGVMVCVGGVCVCVRNSCLLHGSKVSRVDFF